MEPGKTAVQIDQTEATAAMLVDGKNVTRDDYRELAAQLVEKESLVVGLAETLIALCESLISQVGADFELHQQAKKILVTLGRRG